MLSGGWVRPLAHNGLRIKNRFNVFYTLLAVCIFNFLGREFLYV